MKFETLKLFTNKLDEQFDFYVNKVGFKVLDRGIDHFMLKVGWSKLIFERSTYCYPYHYCFLIPSCQLQKALSWMDCRVEVLDLGESRKTQIFDSWNAESFYFYDGGGNLAEFIVHYDLENCVEGEFGIDQVLGVNEMGMPTDNIESINLLLERNIGTKFWKGDRERFGTHGGQQGIFLLPNYKMKKNWFPTQLEIHPSRFEANIEFNGELYNLAFDEEKLLINQK